MANRYVVIAPLGRGAMGEVYRAFDTVVAREVAVKVLRAPGEDAQARLVREARTMARLSDPHVVAVFDVVAASHDDGRVLMAMQYVQGQTLGHWLSHARALEEVLSMFMQAGRGLLAAHRAGILHRDFKPDNVLVDEDEHAFVTDFGIAGVWHEHDASGDAHARGVQQSRAVGTPWYMAPEQMLGQPLDPRADQYAFCLALWEALTRSPFFDTNDPAELFVRKLEPPPAWPRTDVPQRVVDSLYRGLSLRPEERFASMEALLEALDVPARRSPWPRRLALASFTAAAGTLAWSWHMQHAELCTGAPEQMRDAWNETKRRQVRASLLATDVAYAHDTAARVEETLDAYTADWVAQHRAACEATTIRGEQSAAVMDLRMACLQRAKVELQAVTKVLANADPQTVERAGDVLGGLRRLERCEDSETLRAEVPPPPPEQRSAIEALYSELADANALRDAGKDPEALARFERLAARTRAASYLPLHAEVMLGFGDAHTAMGKLAKAEAVYREGFRAALASKQWNGAALTATELIRNLGELQQRPHEALAFQHTVEGLLPLSSAATEAALHSNVALVLEMQGRYVEAEATHRVAITKGEEAWGRNEIQTSAYRGRLASNLRYQKRMDEAEREMLAELSVLQRQLPDDHPHLAGVRLDLGYLEHAQGDYAQAQTQMRLALQLFQKSFGDEHPGSAAARHGLGSALAKLGRHKEALEQFERALQVQHLVHGREHARVVYTLCDLARTKASLGQTTEAREHLDEAARIVETIYGPEHSLRGMVRSYVIPLLRSEGRYEEAEEQARAMVSASHYRDGDPRATSAHDHLGWVLYDRGRDEAAEASFRTAIDLARARVGDEHPELAGYLWGLGAALEGQARHPEARAAYGRAMALLEHTAEEDAIRELDLQVGIARTLIGEGRPDAAVALLEPHEAKARADSEPNGRLQYARLRFALAQALWAAQVDHSRARALARAAATSFEQLPEAHHRERAELEAWLREHR